ncbi:MAG: sigma-70 family RNA polymerase sigma factor [Gammaproteobacteria bacterium]|nr:sigma-70 family RNA polymerase sigma factor [Gammaproteobacteria bacterium]
MKSRRDKFFRRFFQQNQGPLVRFLSRRLADPEEAKDIAQDAFHKMMQLDGAENLEHARAYLFQTAANLALNRIRKRKRQESYVRAATARGEAEQGGTLASPERAALAREQLAQVEAALNKLPLKCQRAFLMHRSRSMTYPEIADELGVSVSTVEKYMIRALQHCRKSVQWDPNL